MIKRSFLPVTALFVVLAVAWASHGVQAFKTEATVSITGRVPVFQQLALLEPVTVVVPAGAARSGDPLVFENVGKMRVMSNAPWTLTVNTAGTSYSAIFVKPSGDPAAAWTRLVPDAPVYHGHPGSYDLSWDIQVVPHVRGAGSTGEQRVDLLFTLVQQYQGG